MDFARGVSVLRLEAALLLARGFSFGKCANSRYHLLA